MRYSIVTPTILRPELLRSCESLDKQTCTDWEQIIMVDRSPREYNPILQLDPRFLKGETEPRRRVIYCDPQHRDFGCTCKHNAHEFARGDYLYYLDDDNYFARDNALEDLLQVTGDWAIFPILNQTEGFYFNDPPGYGKTDTGNILVGRHLDPWPICDGFYGDDAVYVQTLVSKYKYQSFPSMAPVLVHTGCRLGNM